MKEAVAKGYHKLLTYKDEYEVARLHLETRKKAEQAFDGVEKISYHLAPPILSKMGADGRPVKRIFGGVIERLFPVLASLKFLRSTPFDIFGLSAERKMERDLIRQYERDMHEVLPQVNEGNRDIIVALAELPLSIRGFGPVKLVNERKAAKKREDLLNALKYPNEHLNRAAE